MATESAMTPIDAAFTLASAQMTGDETPEFTLEDELLAVQALENAPRLEHWDRSLLAGLRSRRIPVREATVRAVLARLKAQEEAEAEDRYLSTVVNACINNLAGRPPKTRLPGVAASATDNGDEADALEQTSARLIRVLARHLQEHPLQLEHHRSRLLAVARWIEHLPGRGLLAGALVDFQRSVVGDGRRSDQAVAAQLFLTRKLDLYTSPFTSAATLEAYLANDRQLPLEKTSQELFRAYRMLLACQTRERAAGAMLRAMSNLRGWLAQMPQTAEVRRELLGEVLTRARAGEPRESLDVRLCRQLEAHLELLPGREHAEDLLRQLEQRFDSAESESLMIAGLEVLQELPFLRLRSEEICNFTLRPGHRRRSGQTWKALLDLIGCLITGLADFVLGQEELGRREARRLEALRGMLVHDQRLRDLLYRLATDTRLRLSDDAEVERQVRETAWRHLLRSLPQNREELLREGVFQHTNRLFFVTIEEASRAFQRRLWEPILDGWESLTDAPPPERRRRIQALTDYFVHTRPYRPVQEEGKGAGILIRLALDDEDAKVRAAAEAAIGRAGYTLELARERQRRELLALRDGLTASNRRAVELEEEIGRLTHDAVETQVQRAEVGLTVQELLQQRDFQVTDGWLGNAEVQTDLEEVHADLEDALAAARREMQLLRELQGRIATEHAECRQVYSAIERLVSEQERRERERERLRDELARVVRTLEGARSELSSLQSSYSSLSPPSMPSRSSDPEEHARRQRQYQRDLDHYQSRRRSLAQGIESNRGTISSCTATIRSLEQRIREEDAAIARLQREIDQVRRRIAELERRLQALRREFESRQAVCRAIRQEIHRLRGQVSTIERHFESQRSALRGRLDGNRSELENTQAEHEQILDRLQELSLQLNQTGDALDRQRTESQRLIQAIDSGREHYDRIAEQAAPESATADATGVSQRHAYERWLLTDQESLVHHVEGMHQAIRHEPPSPTRQQWRQRRQRQDRPRQKG